MKKPKYSVIIPTKNRGYCIWKSILSIQQQTYPNWELLIVDGNSIDNTKKVVNEFSNDKRIRFIKNIHDTGVASARNKGIQEAFGEFIGYLDSDDFVYADWLEEIDKLVGENKSIIVMPNKHFVVRLVDDSNNVIQTFVDRELYETRPTVNKFINLEIPSDTNGMVHSKNFIKKTGYWDANLKLYEDFDFLIRVFENFSKDFRYISKKLVEYTRTYGKDGLCGKAKYEDLVVSLEYIYKKYKDKKFFKDITWYPTLIEKYKNLKIEEDSNGKTILEHIILKYSNGKNS